MVKRIFADTKITFKTASPVFKNSVQASPVGYFSDKKILHTMKAVVLREWFLTILVTNTGVQGPLKTILIFP